MVMKVGICKVLFDHLDNCQLFRKLCHGVSGFEW